MIPCRLHVLLYGVLPTLELTPYRLAGEVAGTVQDPLVDQIGSQSLVSHFY